MAEITLTCKEDDNTTTHTFTQRKVNADGSTTWDNPGTGAVLAETRTVTRHGRKTKGGILNRSVLLVLPVFNPVTQKYDQRIEGRFTLNAPEAVPLESQEDAASMLRTLLDPAANPDFVANLVRCR